MKQRWPQLIIILAVVATMAALASTVAQEIFMTPSSSERNELLALLGSIAAVAILVTVVFRLFPLRSITKRMFAAAISGPLVIAVALAGGSRSMILSENDLPLLLILLAFATVLGIAVMFTLAYPLTSDLAALTKVAQRVGEGDLNARADLKRMDEVGNLSTAIDSMVDQISTSRSARDEAERERSITLASLSHDARTPLTSMRLATEALLDGVAPDPERYLRTIETDITAVETLITDLFTIGQLEANRLELTAGPMDVMTTVRDVAELMMPIGHKKNVRVLVSGPKQLQVTADPTQLHRVIANVVSNAIRHSPTDDVVCIEVDAKTRLISVLDTGDGFPEDFCEEAFVAFRRHDYARERAQGGAGLGLAVAKGIVDALDGRIWADPGPGGAVHIQLPE